MLSLGEKIAKIGPAHPEIICLREIIKNEKRKKLRRVKYISLPASLLSGLNNLHSNITKQKQFLFIIGKLSGQFFIFKQDHCKANRAHRAINLFACNFAKHSPILIFLSLLNLAINT